MLKVRLAIAIAVGLRSHDLVAPLLHFGIELVVRHERVDQAHRQGFRAL